MSLNFVAIGIHFFTSVTVVVTVVVVSVVPAGVCVAVSVAITQSKFSCIVGEVVVSTHAVVGFSVTTSSICRSSKLNSGSVLGTSTAIGVNIGPHTSGAFSVLMFCSSSWISREISLVSFWITASG